MASTLTPAEQLHDAALRWQDPEHPARSQAVAAALAGENRWTEEAAAYAVNHWTHQLAAAKLEIAAPVGHRRIGIGGAWQVPLEALPYALAILEAGHAPAWIGPPPPLTDAFLRDAGIDMRAADGDVSAVVWIGEEPPSGLPDVPIWQLDDAFGVAVVDGSESDEDWEALAEAAFLHEGLSRRSVAVVWAPAELGPDAFLDAAAAFRAVFPAHASTPGVLRMPMAFLKAAGTPHAFADGPAFLVSKGEPEPQSGPHLRWASFDDPAEVDAWVRANEDAVSVVAYARPEAFVAGEVPVVHPSDVHREGLDTRERASLRAFLEVLD